MRTNSKLKHEQKEMYQALKSNNSFNVLTSNLHEFHNKKKRAQKSSALPSLPETKVYEEKSSSKSLTTSPGLSIFSLSTSRLATYLSTIIYSSSAMAQQVKDTFQASVNVIFHPDAINPTYGTQCGSLEYWCKNWWAEIKNATDGTLIQTVTGNVDTTLINNDGSALTENSLIKCTLDHMQEALTSAFSIAASGLQQVCSIPDSLYAGVKLTMELKEKFHTETCDALKVAINHFQVNECENSYSVINNNGALIGGIVGGILALCVLGCICKCYNNPEKTKKLLKECTERMKEALCCRLPEAKTDSKAEPLLNV